MTIFIATPCYGGDIKMRCARSIMAVLIKGMQRGVDIQLLLTEGESLVQRARNQLTHQFLKKAEKGDKMLFVDADLEFNPEWVFALAALDKGIVGLAYPRKRIEWEELKGAEDPQAAGASYFIHPEPGADAKVPVTDGCIPVRWLGTGFMMIDREVCLRMCEEYPHTAHVSDTYGSQGEVVHALFDCEIDPIGGIYLSEDYLFCKRWRDMGERVWMSLMGSPSHIGNMVFQGNLSKLISPVEA
jgi:hypothetical protein